jgi:hypothetical protein
MFNKAQDSKSVTVHGVSGPLDPTGLTCAGSGPSTALVDQIGLEEDRKTLGSIRRGAMAIKPQNAT